MCLGYGQDRNYTPMELPKLEKFDVSWIDTTKDACTDFFQYACSPADSTVSGDRSAGDLASILRTAFR